MSQPDRRGRFDASPVVTFLTDGRRVKVLRPFGFIDSTRVRWDVPESAIVDGASIPQALWSLIGGPFEGKYRDASVVHDWYCDLRTRPWRHVHRVFYETMLACVAFVRAKVMYAAVYWGCPRWSETVVSNVSHMIETYRKNHPEEAAERDRAGRRFYKYPDPRNYQDPRNYPVKIETTVSRYELKGGGRRRFGARRDGQRRSRAG